MYIFYKTLIIISINRERTTTAKGVNTSLVRIFSFLLFLSWWRDLKRRSNNLEIMWIPLEARTPWRKPCKYVFSYILIDRIIYFVWLDVLNIWFNVFRCIRCFDKKFERLINIRTLHKIHKKKRKKKMTKKIKQNQPLKTLKEKAIQLQG